MNIYIDNKSLHIDGHRLEFDLYYFVAEEFDGPSNGAVFKNVMLKWADVLRTWDGPTFLPYAPDDEWTECLLAMPEGDKVRIKLVRAADNGWAIEMDRLEDFMTSKHRLDWESDEAIGEYEKLDFIEALVRAPIIE